MGFGFGNDAGQEPAEETGDWANAFGNDSESSNMPLDFAKPDMFNALEATQAGQKG